MSEPKILGIGVATMDIYVNQKRMYPGGNEYNIACQATNCGARAGFLGVFADDQAGALLEETLVHIGVDCSRSHHESGSSGYSLVELKSDGDRVFLDWNKQGVTDLYPIMFNDEEMEYVKSFDVSCLGRCASVDLEKIKYLHNEGVVLCYDFHAAFSDEDIENIAPLIRYAFFSCSHLDETGTKSVLKKAVSCGCSIAVGTRGSEKFYAYDGETYYEQEPFKVKARDALGAGDSFIAAFLYSVLASRSDAGSTHQEKIQKALVYAARHAARVVMVDGSTGVYFDVDPKRLDEIINFPESKNFSINH